MLRYQSTDCEIIPTMATDRRWTPDEDTAALFATYKQAVETERANKAAVRDIAREALQNHATVNQLARLTGMTPEVFRRMARDLEVPIDPRYLERAEAARQRAIDKGEKPPVTTEASDEPEPATVVEQPGWLTDWPDIAALTLAEAAERAQVLEQERPEWFAATREDCLAEPPWVNHAMLAADAVDPEPPAAP
jgi:hypothetical protein